MPRDDGPFCANAQRLPNAPKFAHRAKKAKEPLLVDEHQEIIGDLRGEVEKLKAKLVQRENESAQHLVEDARDVELGEHWKEEVVKNVEARTQLQRSLIDVDRGLSQWRAERAHALEVLGKWDGRSDAMPPRGWHSPRRSRREQLQSPAEWQDYLEQTEVSIRESLETRASLEARLEQNRTVGRELHAQLPQRVVNEDTRAFLEMVQRVRGLEVEHLQLDQCWQQRRTQLESKDQEIDVLREQLRVRMDHLQRQRELLSDEQQAQLPEPAGSVLDGTLGKGPLRPRARAKAIQAWIPSSKERREEAHQAPEEDRVGPSSAEAPAEATDVRRAAVPQPPLARGGARFQQPRQGSSLPGRRSPPMGGKGLPEPPGVRPTPYAPSARPLPPKAVAGTPGTGISAQAPVAGGRRAAYVANQSVATSATPEALGAPGPYQARGQTCPPPQPSAAPRPPPPRTSPHPRMEADCIAAKQHLMHLKHVMANGAKKPMADLFSAKADRELGPVAGEKIAPRVLPNGSGVAAPVPAAAAPAGGGGPGSLATGARAASRRRGDARVRARSEQVPSRMNRFGRLVVHAREQELASAPLQSFRF